MVYSQAKDMPCEMGRMQLLEGLSRSFSSFSVTGNAVTSHARLNLMSFAEECGPAFRTQHADHLQLVCSGLCELGLVGFVAVFEQATGDRFSVPLSWLRFFQSYFPIIFCAHMGIQVPIEYHGHGHCIQIQVALDNSLLFDGQAWWCCLNLVTLSYTDIQCVNAGAG